MGFWAGAGQAAAAGGFSIGGNIVSNIMNRRNTAEANDWQNESIANAMAYDKEMANSAHQREVADLKAAGLNPILSANKGAGGGSGQISSPKAAAVEGMGGAVTSAIDALRLDKEIKGVESQIGLNQAMGAGAVAKAQSDAASAKRTEKESRLMDAVFGAQKSKADFEKMDAQDKQKYFLIDKMNERAGKTLGNINSAKDALTPSIKNGIRLRKNESIMNNQTGELRLP